MSEEKKNQKRPLNQKKVEEMLERGDSFYGFEIGDVNFSKHTFKKHVKFESAKFIGIANFEDAKFLNGANFRHAEFSGKGGAYFNGTKFFGDESADFMGANFSGKMGSNFIGATFSGNLGANFHWAKFSGEGGVTFTDAKFSGEGGANFKSAVFSCTKSADFTFAEFFCEDRISFEDVTFEKDCIIYFERIKVKYPKNLFFRNAYLGNTIFFQTDVEDFNFKNVKFRKLPHDKLNWMKRIFTIRREALMDEIGDKFGVIFYPTKIDEKYFSQVEIIYRQLKRNFEEKRDYAKAGDFHFGEMEMKRLQKSKFKQYFSLIAFYKYFSGYGQKWVMALFWFLGFVALFSFLNLNWLQPIQENKSTVNSEAESNSEQIDKPVAISDAIIYTINTMTLRKDTRFEITCSNVLLFVIFQSVVGPTMLALMLLAIRRQFRR